MEPVDWISDTPEPIIDDILMRLTTLEAAKICSLSKQWRYKWAKLPHLIYDYAVRKQSPQWKIEESRRTMRLFLFLDQVLLHHQGPTTKLSFSVPKLQSYSRIDPLIDLLSDHGVEEFTLKLNAVCTFPFPVDVNPKYKLPSSLFMYSELKHLKLDSCLINPPPTFKGFNKLVRLEFNSVTIDDKVLESLISSCPMLEELVLSGPCKIEHIEIDAPMLKFFEFECKGGSIYFKRTPCLETLKIFVAHEIRDQYGNSSFIEFFDSLPALRNLCVDFFLIMFLAADQAQPRLRTPLIHLKMLKFSAICLDELNQFSCVLSLIRSSPNLEDLEITNIGGECPDIEPIIDFLEVQDFSDLFLDKLQKVKLVKMGGIVSEMALIELLLEKSSKLESMVISFNGDTIRRKSKKWRRIVKAVNNFQRASPYAKVIHKLS